MRIALVPAALLLAAAPAYATPTAIEVHLSNFKFAPNEIELKANQDYALTLVNDAGGGHSFAAKEFFAAAKIDPADQASVKEGIIEVPGDSSRTVHFHTAGPGTYKLKCSHTFHAGFGMKGEIVVR